MARACSVHHYITYRHTSIAPTHANTSRHVGVLIYAVASRLQIDLIVMRQCIHDKANNTLILYHVCHIIQSQQYLRASFQRCESTIHMMERHYMQLEVRYKLIWWLRSWTCITLRCAIYSLHHVISHGSTTRQLRHTKSTLVSSILDYDELIQSIKSTIGSTFEFRTLAKHCVVCT